MRRILRVDLGNPGSDVALEVRRVLASSGIICLPTDTCYGLSCLATSQEATSRLRLIKMRDPSKPFILLVPNISTAKLYVKTWSDEAQAISEAFWPGRMTIVVPFHNYSEHPICHSDERIAMRMPDSDLTKMIVNRGNCLIWSTSANSPGDAPPACIQDVPEHIIQNVDLVVDAGRVPTPDPTTIIDLSISPPHILRRGPIEPEAIIQKTGINLSK
ncbi:threonylcarbamoyl-AMP synthase [bacterium]|nr:threonylcarbamoyl-AMP synthase [bacterium]